MNKIYYEMRSGKFECVKAESGKQNDKLELHFKDSQLGAVQFAANIRKIDGKSCIFDTGALYDGIYKPTLYTKNSALPLEAIEIKNGKPKLIPKDDAYIRELSEKIEKLSEKLVSLEKRLGELDTQIKGKPIF